MSYMTYADREAQIGHRLEHEAEHSRTDIVLDQRLYGSLPWRMSPAKVLAAERRRARHRLVIFVGTGLGKVGVEIVPALNRKGCFALPEAGLLYTRGMLVFGKKAYEEHSRHESFPPLTDSHDVHDWDWAPPSSGKPAELLADRTVDVADRFEPLLDAWMLDTRYTSSLHQMFSHPAYLKMIALGPDALPLMLKEMQTRPGRWFMALEAVAHEDPAEGIQDVDAAVDAWLKWASEHGLEIGDD